MAQSNYNIPNDSAPAVRAQLNSVFQSIVSNNSGSASPATTFPHQWWYDTSTNILKQRNAADSAWINIGTFDQTGGKFRPFGELTQGQAQDPTSTVSGTVSGQRLAQSFGANEQQIGIGQTWQDVGGSRAANTVYQNTTGRPISVVIGGVGAAASRDIQVSVNGSTGWVKCAEVNTDSSSTAYFIVPAGHYYRISGTTSPRYWSELR